MAISRLYLPPSDEEFDLWKDLKNVQTLKPIKTIGLFLNLNNWV